MKNQDIQQLLEKYSSGKITAEELQMLNEATHRDSVIKSAAGEAGAIRHRRKIDAMYALVGVALLAGIGTILRPATEPETIPLVAQQEEVVLTPAETNDSVIEQVAPCDVVAKTIVAKQIEIVEEKKEIIIAPVPVETYAPAMIEDAAMPEMQVLCNLQCDADSVLEEVLKFLKA